MRASASCRARVTLPFTPYCPRNVDAMVMKRRASGASAKCAAADGICATVAGGRAPRRQRALRCGGAASRLGEAVRRKQRQTRPAEKKVPNNSSEAQRDYAPPSQASARGEW